MRLLVILDKRIQADVTLEYLEHIMGTDTPFTIISQGMREGLPQKSSIGSDGCGIMPLEGIHSRVYDETTLVEWPVRSVAAITMEIRESTR